MIRGKRKKGRVICPSSHAAYPFPISHPTGLAASCPSRAPLPQTVIDTQAPRKKKKAYPGNGGALTVSDFCLPTPFVILMLLRGQRGRWCPEASPVLRLGLPSNGGQSLTRPLRLAHVSSNRVKISTPSGAGTHVLGECKMIWDPPKASIPGTKSFDHLIGLGHNVAVRDVKKPP